MTCVGNEAQAEKLTWTAVREGAPRRAAAAADTDRSLLQRYGWYVFFAILYFGYQGAKDKAAQTMAGMGKAQ